MKTLSTSAAFSIFKIMLVAGEFVAKKTEKAVKDDGTGILKKYWINFTRFFYNQTNRAGNRISVIIKL